MHSVQCCGPGAMSVDLCYLLSPLLAVCAVCCRHCWRCVLCAVAIAGGLCCALSPLLAVCAVCCHHCVRANARRGDGDSRSWLLVNLGVIGAAAVFRGVVIAAAVCRGVVSRCSISCVAYGGCPQFECRCVRVERSAVYDGALVF